jgi:hypothetical protein
MQILKKGKCGSQIFGGGFYWLKLVYEDILFIPDGCGLHTGGTESFQIAENVFENYASLHSMACPNGGY